MTKIPRGDKSYIGKTVTVTVDRPIGTHHPKHPEIVYPINYGYVEGLLGGDGEEQDVYILGVDKSVDKAECVIIENNLCADGSVKIPEVLRKYMGGIDKIVPKDNK